MIISIFLSLWDVHINRIPVSGRIIWKKHVPGRFVLAFRKEAEHINENTIIGIQSPSGVVYVKQSTGFFARRIICRVRKGEIVTRGTRFGMILFGSRVTLYLPEKTAIQVKVGQRVRGGETVIGKFIHDNGTSVHTHHFHNF